MKSAVFLAIVLLTTCPHFNSGQASSDSSDTSEERQKRDVSEEDESPDRYDSASLEDTSMDKEREKRFLSGAHSAPFEDTDMEEEKEKRFAPFEDAYSDAGMAMEAVMRAARSMAQEAQLRQSRQLSPGSEDTNESDGVNYDISAETDEASLYDEAAANPNDEEMDKRNFQYRCSKRECNKKCSSMNLGMGGNCGSTGKCYCNRKKARARRGQYLEVY